MGVPESGPPWNSPHPIVSTPIFVNANFLPVVEIVRRQHPKLSLVGKHDENVLAVCGIRVVAKVIQFSWPQSGQQPENAGVAFFHLHILPFQVVPQCDLERVRK